MSSPDGGQYPETVRVTPPPEPPVSLTEADEIRARDLAAQIASQSHVLENLRDSVAAAEQRISEAAGTEYEAWTKEREALLRKAADNHQAWSDRLQNQIQVSNRLQLRGDRLEQLAEELITFFMYHVEDPEAPVVPANVRLAAQEMVEAAKEDIVKL